MALRISTGQNVENCIAHFGADSRRREWGDGGVPPRAVSIPVLLPVLLTRRHRSSAVIVERQAARLEAVDVVRRYNRPSVNDGDGRRPAKPALIGLLIRGSSVRSRDGSPIFSTACATIALTEMDISIAPNVRAME